MTHPFDWTSLAARVLFSFLVVFAVYNPSGHSYWHWSLQGDAAAWTKILAGLTLIGVHGVVIKSVLGVLKWRGVILVALTLFAGWMAIPTSIGIGEWAGGRIALLAGLSLVYATGLSYPHIHHRLAGIVHVEKVP